MSNCKRNNKKQIIKLLVISKKKKNFNVRTRIHFN